MTRWEYLTLNWRTWLPEGKNDWVQRTDIRHPDGRIETILDEVVNSETKWDIMTAISDLGWQGWEMIQLQTAYGAYIQGTGQNYHALPVGRSYYFKRPMQG
jgi:hypothetical protein